jgi:hypothetical protein
MNLVKHTQFNKNCNIYKEKKKNVKEISTFIKNTIVQNTQKEVEELEKSIKKLNKKVETILQNPNIKQKKQILEKETKDMILSLNNVMSIYSEAREIIIKDNSINQQQRMNYLKKLEEKMMDKLYSSEEKEHFKRMVSNMIIMVPCQRMNFNNNLGQLTNRV